MGAAHSTVLSAAEPVAAPPAEEPQQKHIIMTLSLDSQETQINAEPINNHVMM